jgi:hypothetical protein
MLNELSNIAIKRVLCRVLICAFIGICALVYYDCHRKDELRAIRGQVYGDRAAVERVLDNR